LSTGKWPGPIPLTTSGSWHKLTPPRVGPLTGGLGGRVSRCYDLGMPKIADDPAPRDRADADRIRTTEILAAAPDVRADKARNVAVTDKAADARQVVCKIGEPGAPSLTATVVTDPRTGKVISISVVDWSGKSTAEEKNKAVATALLKATEVSEQRGDPRPQPERAVQAADRVRPA